MQDSLKYFTSCNKECINDLKKYWKLLKWQMNIKEISNKIHYLI